jgi:RimJ/RimL family protein N-acetyltransferase
MLLREVEPADVAVFYEHQADAGAARLAAVPSRDRETHAAHWQKILADPDSLIRTVVTDDGRVAGQVMSFSREGVREVGYWLGREFWGRGLASAAVRAFLEVERHRPLHGAVAEHNTASLHVLERNGFAVVGLERHDDEEPPVRLIVLRLDA